MGELDDEASPWFPVEMAAFFRGLEILAAADQNDPKAMDEAMRMANAEIGIFEPGHTPTEGETP